MGMRLQKDYFDGTIHLQAIAKLSKVLNVGVLRCVAWWDVANRPPPAVPRPPPPRPSWSDPDAAAFRLHRRVPTARGQRGWVLLRFWCQRRHWAHQPGHLSRGEVRWRGVAWWFSQVVLGRAVTFLSCCVAAFLLCCGVALTQKLSAFL